MSLNLQSPASPPFPSSPATLICESASSAFHILKAPGPVSASVANQSKNAVLVVDAGNSSDVPTVTFGPMFDVFQQVSAITENSTPTSPIVPTADGFNSTPSRPTLLPAEPSPTLVSSPKDVTLLSRFANLITSAFNCSSNSPPQHPSEQTSDQTSTCPNSTSPTPSTLSPLARAFLNIYVFPLTFLMFLTSNAFKLQVGPKKHRFFQCPGLAYAPSFLIAGVYIGLFAVFPLEFFLGTICLRPVIEILPEWVGISVGRVGF